MTDRTDYIAANLRASMGKSWPNLYGITRDDIAFLIQENRRLIDANDRIARIASQVAVTLEEGKRDLMAHGWEVGYDAGRSETQRGRIVRANPYKEQP